MSPELLPPATDCCPSNLFSQFLPSNLALVDGERFGSPARRNMNRNSIMRTSVNVPAVRSSALLLVHRAKTVFPLAILAIYFLMHGSQNAVAQAPSLLAGRSLSFIFTDTTTPPWAPPGTRGLILMAGSGNAYTVVHNDSGTYSSYSASGAIATADFTDAQLGLVGVTFDYLTPSSGTIHATNAPSYANGDFELFSGAAPSSVAGNTYYLQIEAGVWPFASTGSLLLKTSSAGAASYALVGDQTNTADSFGTYSYLKVNTATGRLLLNDSTTGGSETYLSFSNSIIGGFTVMQTPSGFWQVMQVGHFINLQTAVQILSPVAGSSYSTGAAMINLAGTASDNLGISQVIWTNNLGGGGTASGTTNWTADGVVLQPGFNLITVTALDTVANAAEVTLGVTYAPTLSIALQGGDIVFSWPTNFARFRLQTTAQLESGVWTNGDFPWPPTVVNGHYAVITPITFSAQKAFYRLSN